MVSESSSDALHVEYMSSMPHHLRILVSCHIYTWYQHKSLMGYLRIRPQRPTGLVLVSSVNFMRNLERLSEFPKASLRTLLCVHEF